MSKKLKFCPLCGGKLKIKRMPKDEHPRQVCSACGFILYCNPVPTVLAIVERGNKILLTKRGIAPHKGYWDLPGGFVEIGQNLEDALRQEIKEELGVEVKSLTYYGSFVSKYKILKMTEDIVGSAFKVKLKSEDFKPGSDVDDVRWFDKDNLPKVAPFGDAQTALKKLLGR